MDPLTCGGVVLHCLLVVQDLPTAQVGWGSGREGEEGGGGKVHWKNFSVHVINELADFGMYERFQIGFVLMV